MITLALAGALLAILAWLWLTATVKLAVVQPVNKKGELTGPFLSKKPRWKLLKEEGGWLAGLGLGFMIGLLF